MDSNPTPVPAAPPGPSTRQLLAADWSGVLAGLLNPTMVTTIIGATAAFVLGGTHTFGAPVDLDLVYLGLGMLGGAAITRRA